MSNDYDYETMNRMTYHLDENINTNVLIKVDSMCPCTTCFKHLCRTLSFRQYLCTLFGFFY